MKTTQEGERVEVLHRKTEPAESKSHLLMRFTMHGEKDLAQFRKTFPDPMPGTHRLAYRWGTNAAGAPFVEVGPELVPVQGPLTALGDGRVIDEAGKPVNLNAAEAADHAEHKTDQERIRLTALPEADLLTLAAEREVKVNKKWSKAQLVAAVLEAAPKPA